MIGELFSDGRLWVALVTQATCCIAVGLAASYLWRHRAARAHRVLLVALSASMVMPVSYLFVRHFGFGMLTRRFETVSYNDQDTPMLDELDPVKGDEAPFPRDPTELEMTASVPMSMDEPVAHAQWPWFATGLLCWAAASAVLFGRLLRQFTLGVRLLRSTQDVEAGQIRNALEQAKNRIGIHHPIRLQYSQNVRSPLIWCWRRIPVLLVHKHAGVRSQRCDWVGVFCHELAHWKRLDHISGLFCELLLCIVPWHPLLWWARARLVTLSEEACDDWVLAAGQVGVDYAESLLDLSPQSQMAFLPTVVGKEKAMKERIRRIVKDKCGNPRTGRWWALVVVTVALGTSITVALAQPRPPAPEPPEQPLASEQGPLQGNPRQLAIEGRRNVLNRMLDDLRNQARRIEFALQDRGDAQDDQTVILRAELTATRNHIELIERQLENLERPRDQEPTRAVLQPVAEARQRLDQIRNRIQRAETRLKELEEQGHGDSEEADKIRENLRSARLQVRAMRERAEAAPPVAQGPAPARRRAALRQRIAQLEEELQNVENPQGDKAGQLRRELRQSRADLQQLGRDAGPPQPEAPERPNAERAPAAPRPQAQLQAEVQELQAQMTGLNRQMQQMKKLLEQLVQQKDVPAPSQP
jgi:beta-lactamase regulating signal transducer with metallopeptidase domain